MTTRIHTQQARKRRDAARRRAHRRIANEELKKNGTPKAETMKELNRSYAATVGNQGRWAKQRAYDRERQDAWDAEHPTPAGAAYMHRGILTRIERMTYHERMDRARLCMARLLLSYRLGANFTPDTFIDWKARILRALTYRRSAYRKLETHSEAQADAHVMLELVIGFIRQGSEPLIRKWLHERQVAEHEDKIARLKLQNPTATRRI